MASGWQRLLAIGLALLSCRVAGSEALQVSGTARHLQTQQIAYREFHDINTTYHHVRYTTADGKTFATKSLDYTHGLNTPLYRLLDQRFDRLTGNEWLDDQFSVYRQAAGHALQRKNLQPAADLVIDAGFDHFVRQQWQALQAGETVPFDFIVADPLVKLHMQLVAMNPAQSPIRPSHAAHCYFKASSRNRLIGWAIPDIHLAYDCNNRLLQVYRGPSNLTDHHNRSQQVIIDYQYTPAALTFSQGDDQP